MNVLLMLLALIVAGLYPFMARYDADDLGDPSGIAADDDDGVVAGDDGPTDPHMKT